MINQKICNIFNNSISYLNNVANKPDWAIARFLDSARRGQFRNAFSSRFNMDYNEELLYCRDTSFWNSANEGIIITDAGIYIIPDNNDNERQIYFPWGCIVKAEYRDGQLNLLYHSEEGDVWDMIGMELLVKEYDNSKRDNYGLTIARAINNVVNHLASQAQKADNQTNKFFEEFAEKYDALREEGKTKEAADWAYQCYAQQEHGFILSCALVADEDNERALKYLNKEMSGFSHNDDVFNTLKAIYADKVCNVGAYSDARYISLDAYSSASEELEFLGVNIKSVASETFGNAESAYLESFYRNPYQQRKLLMAVERYSDLSQNQMVVLEMDSIKKLMDNEENKMTFPMGHLMANQLYVAHPLTQTHYIPFESYEIELIKDRVREFCELMECMGATSISIQYQQQSNTNGEWNKDDKLSGNGNIGKLYSAQGSIHQQETNNFMQSLGQNLNLHQTYQPFQQPYVPENLIWYSQEPSWQRLVEQRMRGSITSHTESIETSKTQVINNESLTEIEAELKVLLSNANLSISSATSEKLKQHDNVVLSIHVEFAPLSSLGQTQYTELPNLSSEQMTDDESEYVEMYQEAIAEGNGQINTSARKLLDKFASRFGISASRAAQLEQLHAQIFTPEEQEYIEEVRAVIAEDGALSSMSIRLLQKFAAKLGVSPERANELNTYAK